MKTRTNTDHSGPASGSPLSMLAARIGVVSGVGLVWFVLHLPALGTPPLLAAPVVGVAWLGLAVALARIWRMSRAEGAGGGLVAAVIGLLLLGSMLVRPGEAAAFDEPGAALRPAAILLAAGFVVGGAFLGFLGAAIASAPRVGAPTDPLVWHSRLAVAVAASFVPLMLIGGIVTSTESGMAVRDWPSTFGSNMFLYPQELMREQPRVYFEHMHRLFGSLVGVCTLVLWVSVLCRRGVRGRFGVWATGLFLAVCVQGYLGGQRVLLDNPYLGAVHGVFGQVVFAFAATLAVWMSPGYTGLPAIEIAGSRRMRVLATAALHSTILQLVFGAMYRHLRRGDNPGASHVAWTHIGFALVVVGTAVLAGAMLIRLGRERGDSLPGGLGRGLRRLGASIHGVVGLQFALGWAAFLLVMTGDSRGRVPTSESLDGAAPVPVAEVLASTAHHANGALLLVLVMLCWAWARRLHRASSAATRGA